MPITPSFMQARKSTYAVYSARMAVEREKKGKEKRLKEQMQKEDQEKQEAIKTLDQKTLEDIETSVTEEQDKCKVGWLVEWGFYALSASKAIFRARTYNCNLFSPVMMTTR